MLKEKVKQSPEKILPLRRYVLLLCVSSRTYTNMGRWDEAIREGETALKAADEHSDANLSSFANLTISVAYRFKGDLTRAIESAELAVRKASNPTDYQLTRSALAWVYCCAGEPEKDLDYLASTVQGYSKAESHLFLVARGTMLGEGYLLNHQYDEAKQVLEATLKSAEKIGMKYYAGQCYRLLGEVSLKTDPAQEKRPSAASYFEKAIAICQEIKAENYLALAYAGLGRYHKQKGYVGAARQYLSQALEIFERLGTLLEPDKVRKELAQLPEGKMEEENE
ncbi:MAG: hypothetical protein P8010_06955 [Desulfosarcinaceae bacterium]